MGTSESGYGRVYCRDQYAGGGGEGGKLLGLRVGNPRAPPPLYESLPSVHPEKKCTP